MIIIIITFISADPQDVYISVSDVELLNIYPISTSSMTNTVTFGEMLPWKYTNIEQVMPPNTTGRLVYVYLKSHDNIYVREMEVFAPFSFGQ